MEEIIAVKFEDLKRGKHAFLSWGRLDDPVDPQGILSRIQRLLPGMGFKDVVHVEMCWHVGEVSSYDYFYEGLLKFSLDYAKRVSDPNFLDEIKSDDLAFRRHLCLLPSREAREIHLKKFT